MALGATADAEQQLRDAVHAARANGRSWGMISLVLGVSKQAARQRYGDHAQVSSQPHGRVPETEDEISGAEASARAMVAEEPW